MGLYFTFALTILVEIVFPVLLGFWIIHRYHTTWKLIGIGGLIYLGAQVIHIPLLSGIDALFSNNILPTPTGAPLIVLNAVLGGLAVGICEETARLFGFRFLKSQAQTEGGAFSLGAGHAGIETILIAGLPMLATFATMITLKNADPKNPALDPTTVSQIANLWAMAWYTPLASALERLVAMTTQLALTFVVLQVFLRKSYWFFAAAIAWHALTDGLILGLVSTNLTGGAILGVEVVLGMASGSILWYLLSHQPLPTPI